MNILLMFAKVSKSLVLDHIQSFHLVQNLSHSTTFGEMIENFQIYSKILITVDFEEVKTAPTEYKENAFR